MLVLVRALFLAIDGRDLLKLLLLLVLFFARDAQMTSSLTAKLVMEDVAFQSADRGALRSSCRDGTSFRPFKLLLPMIV